jgi:hypothetical protein
MKKSLYLLPAVLIGIFMAVTGCQDKKKDSCEQDAICESKEVSACCTDTVCVWKYNGKEYTKAELPQLAIDLGCPSSKAADQDNDLAQISKRLRDLMSRAQCHSKSND